MPEITCAQCGGVSPATFRFCGHCGAKLEVAAAVATAVAAPAPTAPPPVAAGPARDERRQVTVLFADVSGFTSMSEGLDPEDVHAVMNQVFAGLGQAIRDEGGTIDKYIGDNVMALFGAPLAHADDPLRACRAALNMQAFLRDFSVQLRQQRGVTLRMRIGVNDGLVVAGEVGSDLKRQYSVMGDAVNVASRLESAAEPGSILVSDAVRRRSRHRFHFGPPRQLALKGKSEALTAYVLLDERPTDEPEAGMPFVGRRRELEQLVAMMAGAEARRVIELRGEPGVGKARLCREAAARAGVRLVSVTLTAGIARRPFGLLRRAIQALLIDHSGAVATVENVGACGEILAQLDPALADYRDALWYVVAPVLAPADPPDRDPQTLRRTVERGFEQLLSAFAAQHHPAALFIRDHPWADPASAQWLRRAAENAGQLALPLVVACAEEEAAPLPGAAVMALEPLPPEDAAALLDTLAPAGALPPQVRQDLLERAAGVPLFLDELLRSLPEAGAVTGGALPASLRSALASRIDRLDEPARNLLHQCSVQGVEFNLDVAVHVRQDPGWAGPPIPPLIQTLEQQRLVTRSAAPQSQRLRSFRQHLAHQVCYETILKRDRRTLHALTADALRALAVDPSRVAGDLLAYHEERAERWGLAAEATLRAGEDAAGLYLNEEALRRFAHAIELAQRASAGDVTARRTVALSHRGAARVHLLTGEYAQAGARARRMLDVAGTAAESAEARRLLAQVQARTGAAAEALRLLEQVVQELAPGSCRDLDVLNSAWADLAQLHHRAGRLDEAMNCAQRSRDSICSNPQVSGVQADLLQGAIHHSAGRFEAAQQLYERALESAAATGSLSHLARAANCVGNCARDRGDYATARRSYQRALETWQRMSDAECSAGAHTNLGNVAMSLGEFEEAARQHRTALEAWTGIGNTRGAALAHANLAILALERNDGAAAIGACDAALARLETGGDQLLRDLVEIVRAEGLLRCDRVEEAQHRLNELLHDEAFASRPLALAGARRALGRAALLAGDPPAAEALLEQALSGFESLNRTQELARTRLLLSRVLAQTGRPDEALRQARQAAQEAESIHAARDLAAARQCCAELRSRS